MKISVIGLGKLGLPLVAVLADAGHEVIGVDVDSTRVESVNRGECPIRETGLAELLKKSVMPRYHRDRVWATLDTFQAVANSSITFVVVPTPSLPDGSFSMERVNQAMEEIGKVLRTKTGYHLVVLTSTVMPGSTERVMHDLEAVSGRKCGKDFGLCYNPEFIALGSVIHDMQNPDMVLIGESDKQAGDILQDHLYWDICMNEYETVRTNFVNAELAKLAVNSFVTMKISFANTLARICERLPGANVDDVTRAVGMDSRIGGKYLKGAIGYGGPCFPRDNKALSLTISACWPRDAASLPDVTDGINECSVPHLIDLVESHCGAVSRIAVLGLAYKSGTDVVERSQGMDLAMRLAERGWEVVSVYDPMAMDNARRVGEDYLGFAGSAQECVDAASVIVIAEPCPEFADIKGRGQTLIDCWRMLPPEKHKEFNYVPLGVGPRVVPRVTIKP